MASCARSASGLASCQQSTDHKRGRAIKLPRAQSLAHLISRAAAPVPSAPPDDGLPPERGILGGRAACAVL